MSWARYLPPLLCAVLVVTGGATLAAERASFGNVIAELRHVCNRPPAAACAERVMAFFDGDGNGLVSWGELEAARLLARAGLDAGRDGVSNTERGLLALALLALENTGSDVVFAGFDSNGDGGIGRDEMFADIRLDGRALSDIVADPGAVDWQGFAGRFGMSGRLFLPLLRAESAAR